MEFFYFRQHTLQFSWHTLLWFLLACLLEKYFSVLRNVGFVYVVASCFQKLQYDLSLFSYDIILILMWFWWLSVWILANIPGRNCKMITRNLEVVKKKILSWASSYVRYYNVVCLGEPQGMKRSAKECLDGYKITGSN